MRFIASEGVLHGHETLMRRNMGKHDLAGHVADGVNARDARLHLFIHQDLAALAGRDADVLEAEALRVQRAADGHEDRVGPDLLSVAQPGDEQPPSSLLNRPL